MNGLVAPSSNKVAKTGLEKALESFVWDKVTWTFKVTPQSDGFKEGRIKAEWPGSSLMDGYTRIFNTRDAKKMTEWEWIAYNQQQMIKDIVVKLEVKYKDTHGVYVNGVWYAYGDTSKPII